MYDGMQEYLEAEEWVVKTVRELGFPNAKDAKLRAYAKDHNMILVTQDRKSADVAKRNGVKCVLVDFGDISVLVKEQLRRITTR